MLNEFYVATFLHLYQLWKSQQKTVSDSGFVLKGNSLNRVQLTSLWNTITSPLCLCSPPEVELFAKKNPKQMLRRLDVFLRERRSGSAPRASPDPTAQQPSPCLGERGARSEGTRGKEMHFTGVCELPLNMEGEARLI